MDFQGLEAFIAVAELGSFSQAGERLYLTQPAISKRIANLEQLVGTPLFDRVGRDVYLTEAGALLQTRASKLINDAKDLQSAVQQLQTQPIRHLTMASSHHIGLHYLGPILNTFNTNNPEARLDVRFLESEQTIESLLKRQIELALTTIPSPLNPALTAKTLWQDPLVFAVAKQHPLATRQSALRLNELSHLTAILPDRKTTTFKIVEHVFQRHHIPLTRVLSVNYLETIKALVSHNLGWSLLPASMINSDLRVLQVERVHLSRNLGAIWHRRRTLSRGAHALLAIAGQKAQPVTP